MYQAPGFSSFRSLLSNWDDYCFWESVQDNVKNLIDGQGLILFFTKGDDVFGASEDGRMAFARMKQPEKDDDDWMDDASFMAINLGQALVNGGQHVMFGKKDLKKIKVIDRDEAEKTVLGKLKDDDAKAPAGHPLRMLFTRMIQIIPKNMSGKSGMVKLKDEE